jgi:hypothetical protein
MDLDWSEQSPHIRSLYSSWQPGDGYDEEAIASAEARCRVQLPAILRAFYATWGRRRDLTQMNEHLLAPDEWVVHSNALLFCVENQSCAYWALPLESLVEAVPPVVVAEAGPEMSVWEVTADLVWRTSHRRVSTFLDDLTYLHAFSGGAVHGAQSGRVRPLPEQTEWLERDWLKATVTPLFQLREPEATDWWGSPLYVRDGQALDWFDRFFAVADCAESLDRIAQVLAIDWEKRW